MPPKKKSPAPAMNRRQFLKLMGLSGLSAFVAGCGQIASKTLTSTVTQILSPTATLPTASQVPTITSAYQAMAAIGQAQDYDPGRLYDEVKKMLEGIGGLADLVKPGAHVAIKPNLTGGPSYDSGLSVPAAELYVTHPALVGVLVRLFHEAGAGKVTIVEGVGDMGTYSAWGYTAMAKVMDAGLVDLCQPDPYPDFADFPVGPKFDIYQYFHFNPILKDVDVFVSVAKMKCHATAGITLSMKNLFGIVPPVFYRRSDKDSYRSSFHSTEKFDKRVPRVILDLNRIRPVNLSIIDGIGTCEGGEGPWIEGIKPVRPELLVAGKDPLATDTVAAALMGFDASGSSGQQPFIHGDNHFVLAGAAGLGCNDLSKIGIIGPSIEEARFNFEPAS
jgi:uncharacterized protein (DUF362 family)